MSDAGASQPASQRATERAAQPAQHSEPGPQANEEPGYAEAMAEVEAILAELEAADVDVDHLVDRLARASALLDRCRARIDAARADVERLNLD